ncbi:type II secretion system protein [Clostridium sp. D2Q-14]|uniref:competence type IV pilus major pilin ComGC n=1 Tax=Anaeromonas gelatinilytica TaxID=2683194 RepID=UPI00193AEFEB|nr:type II secretion system protein [Anaeromonas gelatinilytica]MBS4536185.1 type II secretion system protein [Anaeromonas gelatinilytica]
MIKIIGKRINNNRGFTLFEVILVLTILGIIAIIAVPKFMNIQADAKSKADEATAVNIAKAGELACIQNPNEIIDIDYLVDNDYLDKEPKAQKKDETGFIISVNSDGKITVNYSGENGSQLYPINNSK